MAVEEDTDEKMQPGSYRYQTFYRQLKPIQTAQ